MPAISKQQAALNTNVSLSFSFPSFFFLSLLLKVVRSTRSFTVHETNFFCLFLSFSEYMQVSIFGKVRRKNSFKMYLSFSKSSFPRFLSFTGERFFFRIWRESTCYLLSKILLRSFPPERAGNRPLYLSISVSKLNSLSLFPLTKRVLLPALRLRPIICFLPPPPPYPAMLLNDLYFFSVHPVTECRQLLAYTFNGQSLGPVNSNTEG